MGRQQQAAQAICTEEVETMHMEERVAKLESDVAHIRSDVSDIKLDQREMKQEMRDLHRDLVAQGEKLSEKIASQGKELDKKIADQSKEITSLAMSLEKFKGSTRVAFAILIVLQLLQMGGVPSMIARAFKL